MSRKVIFLMGAPTSQSLRWDEDELLETPIPPFYEDRNDGEKWPFSDSYPIRWRLLQDQGAMENDCDNIKLEPSKRALFFTTQDLTTPNVVSTIGSDDSALSQFYDHSFAVHEKSEISTSGVHVGDSLQESSLFDSTRTSFATTSEREAPGSGFLPIQGRLSDLQDIPNAAYLHSIVPQTMTINLIVGIIAIHPPRRVITRQWKRELDLVEMVVGDETRTGFGVTFWLPARDHKINNEISDNEGDNGLRKSLEDLRPRDIVLLRMVGLTTFQERVYGQSLRNGLTKVDLLHRQRVDATDAGGIYDARRLQNLNDDTAKPDDLPLMKTRKVREWIKRFVGSATDRAGGGVSPKRGQKQTLLPPDTQ